MFQASEGGSVSVGRRKVQSKIGGTGATPTPAPQIKLEGAPRAIAGYGTERLSTIRAGGVTPLASPTVREIVLSKTSLTGICLITFACGIVTTVMVDRARTRGSDRDVAAHEPDPTPARTAPEQVAPAPLAPVAPLPAAPAPSASSAAEAVVVQMPNLETAKPSSLVPIWGPAVAAGRSRPVAPAPVTSAKNKPVVALRPAPATKDRAAPTVVAAATTKPTPATAAPAKTKPTPTVVAPAKAKPTPALAATKATATKATATRTKAATAIPVAAKAKPAGPGPSAAMAKKTKSGDPLVPPTEWVDPFLQ